MAARGQASVIKMTGQWLPSRQLVGAGNRCLDVALFTRPWASITKSYGCSRRLCLNCRHWPVLMVSTMFLRQRRMATGITLSTAGCQVGTSAKLSSTTQSKRMPGMARAASVNAGNAWMTSPRDEVLINSTRNLINPNRQLDRGRAINLLQCIRHPLRFQQAQAVVMPKTASALETGAAVQPQAHHFNLVG